MYREARVDEVRALSVLLSEFQRLVLPQISSGSLEEAVSLNGENNRSSMDIISSDTSSNAGRVEVTLSQDQEEPDDSSSSQVFPVCVCLFCFRKHTFIFHLVDANGSKDYVVCIFI